jgi:hypothetical protein
MAEGNLGRLLRFVYVLHLNEAGSERVDHVDIPPRCELVLPCGVFGRGLTSLFLLVGNRKITEGNVFAASGSIV